MRVVEKKVYYCDHCKKHGLRRVSLEQHERGCTMNPDRECRWKFGGNDHVEVDLRALVAAISRRGPELHRGHVDWLRDEVDGCPACMLAGLRQSALEYHGVWDYAEEVDRFRAAERREEDRW